MKTALYVLFRFQVQFQQFFFLYFFFSCTLNFSFHRRLSLPISLFSSRLRVNEEIDSNNVLWDNVVGWWSYGKGSFSFLVQFFSRNSFFLCFPIQVYAFLVFQNNPQCSNKYFEQKETLRYIVAISTTTVELFNVVVGFKIQQHAERIQQTTKCPCYLIRAQINSEESYGKWERISKESL